MVEQVKTAPTSALSSEGPNDGKTRFKFALGCEGQRIALTPGRLIVGRSSACHIVVDDLLTSREHAQLVVTQNTLTVEDAGSTNGVYVNEERIREPRHLRDGDRIVIGTQELRVFATQQQPSVKRTATAPDGLAVVFAEPKPTPSTASGLMSIDEPGEPIASRPREGAKTEKADVFLSLGRLADRMLTMGRFDAAERVLDSQLAELVRAARDGMRVPLDVLEVASSYALKLADVTRKARWVDVAIELHLLAQHPMSGPSVTQLAALLPVMPGVDRELFFGYQQALRGKQDSLSLADRVLCDRILRLEPPA
ncbi:MAG: FHA domain-containing protein [Polyangiaceae bacterium]|jgi:hypothetical protein|nr:FHA domain-containing protein [Polyangiaceae bacterium]